MPHKGEKSPKIEITGSLRYLKHIAWLLWDSYNSNDSFFVRIKIMDWAYIKYRY